MSSFRLEQINFIFYAGELLISYEVPTRVSFFLPARLLVFAANKITANPIKDTSHDSIRYQCVSLVDIIYLTMIPNAVPKYLKRLVPIFRSNDTGLMYSISCMLFKIKTH
ncbi:hypothetical protein BH18THE1_BH18THE1_16010 [soil metagenome]